MTGSERLGNSGGEPDTHRGASSEVAERAIDVLLCFLDGDEELGVTEISRRLGIEKGRVHRFLTALKRKGLVADNPKTHKYGLGFRVLELSSAMLSQLDLISLAEPFLRELRDITGETSAISVYAGNHRIPLAQVESAHEIRQSYIIGKPLPLGVGSAGKSLMAYLPRPEIDRILVRGITRVAEHTITDPDLLLKDLEEIRRRGYATSLGERTEGALSIAAPAWSWRGELLAVIVSGPSYRFTPEKARGHVPLLKDICARLTRRLGGERFAAVQAETGTD